MRRGSGGGERLPCGLCAGAVHQCGGTTGHGQTLAGSFSHRRIRKKQIQLAQELKELNDARKDMTLRGTEEAKALIARSDLKNDAVLVVPLYACHEETLAGVVPGRSGKRTISPPSC